MLLDHQTQPDLKRFFEVVLPAVLANAPPVKGRCLVEVFSGPSWLIDFAAGQVTVGGGPSDARIRASAEDFAALLTGALDGSKAVAEERLLVEGDEVVVMHLAELMEQAGA
ncbi:MAG: SCP2 sterol-binding domain-containing protein [Myxococcota bacterium]